MPDVDRYLLPAIAVVIALSLLPIGWELARAHRRTHPHDHSHTHTVVATDAATTAISRRPAQ